VVNLNEMIGEMIGLIRYRERNGFVRIGQKSWTNILCWFSWLAAAHAACAGTGQEKAESRYVEPVRTFADNVLRFGLDTYGPKHTPLFVDGINVDTHEPALWELPAEFAAVWKMPRRWVMSNLACQQILFRVLDSLTLLTGDPKYRQAALEATRYAFEHLQYKDGLLFWGGHAMFDVASDRPVGESHKDWSRDVPLPPFWEVGVVHELKQHCPYYELMWEVNPEATRRFIEGFWSSHILHWDTLDMSRHGLYGPAKGSPWEHAYAGGPVPFVSEGLPLMDAGGELIYAAGTLYQLTGDRRPLVWAKRLGQRYVDIRHRETGLGADVYSLYKHRNEDLHRQFGPEFGDRFSETGVASIYGIRYSTAAIYQMKLYERLGPAGEPFKQWAVEDLTAYARHAYDPADNRFWFMLTDGTKIGPADWKRAGSFSPRQLNKRAAGGTHFFAYALAYKLTTSELMWDMARHIGLGLDLGDTGTMRGRPTRLNLDTSNANAQVIFGLLELYEATKNREYLALARKIGDNLLRSQFHKGFFVPSEDHLFSRFDTATPLALLHLEVALRGLPVELPPYVGNTSFFTCTYAGKGRVSDGIVFSRRRP